MSSKDNQMEEVQQQPELVQIDKWDGCALKNTLDDHVMKVFIDKLGYTQSNRLVDTRLAICFLAVGAAVGALVYDYLNPFPQSKTVLSLCVLSYFVLMGVLTLYSHFVEKGIFLVAYDKTKRWTVSSNLKRFDHHYELYLEAKFNNKNQSIEFKKSVANYFDENGVFAMEKFEGDVVKLHNQAISKKTK